MPRYIKGINSDISSIFTGDYQNHLYFCRISKKKILLHIYIYSLINLMSI